MTKKHPSDVSAQTALIGHTEDDIRWKKERRRKYKAKVEIDEAIAGPACANCRHWTAPGEHDDFGHCMKLITVLSKPGYFGPDRGVTLGVEDVMKPVDYDWQFMRTRPSFAACSRYDAVQVALAADESEAAA